MKISMESTINISTQTAAMLTGKSVRTINNWLALRQIEWVGGRML